MHNYSTTMHLFKTFVVAATLATCEVSGAVVNHYGNELHTTVMDDTTGFHFRYVYPAGYTFSFPNSNAVTNYFEVHDKVTLVYFDSQWAPAWGTVLLNNSPQKTYVPVPESRLLLVLVCIPWLLTRVRV